MAASQKKSGSESSLHKNLTPVLICLALAILTIIAFWQIKDCGFINLDDNIYVYENAYVQSGLKWESVKQAFSSELVEKSGQWLPVIWLSLMLDHQIFGLNPSGYHLTNLLLHIINTVLLFLILRRMTKALWPSAFVAALFAIHPLHVESVAWITERKDVLSIFFWILTLGAYSYYIERPGFRRYFFILLFFVLGLMSKPILVTLPFVLLLLDYWPLQRFGEINPGRKVKSEALKTVTSDQQKKKSRKKNFVKEVLEPNRAEHTEYKWSMIYPLLWEKIPLFVLAILLSITTYFATRIAGAVSVEDISLVVRIGNAFVSYIAYIGKMIWPNNLAVLYPHTKVLVPWQVFGSTFLLIAITLVVIWKAKKFPYLAVGWLWYIGTIVPNIGIVQAGPQAMADRFTYVPLMGLFIMVAWGVPVLLKEWKHKKEILVASAALILLVLSILTWKQVGYWQSSLTLFDHTLKVTDNNWFTYHSRANAYYDLGDYKFAIEDYNKTIAFKPRYREAYINRGITYNKLGNYQQAIEDFDRAIEIKPDFPEAYNNRGNALLALGNYQRAIEDFNKAIEIKPDYATAYNSRGNAGQGLDNYHQAIEDYGRAIENKPRYAEAYYNRGTAYNKLGNYQRAIEDLNRAIEIKPDYPEAYVNRGFAYKGLGNYEQAIEDYGSAIQIKPDYTFAYLNRVAAYVKLGNNELAVNDLKMAAKLGDENAKKLLRGKGIN